MPRDDTCSRWPGATTSYSMKRGSTLLLHSVKPLIQTNSEVPFIRPEPPTCTTRRLSVIPGELLLFIIAGGYLFFVPGYYNRIEEKTQAKKAIMLKIGVPIFNIIAFFAYAGTY